MNAQRKSWKNTGSINPKPTKNYSFPSQSPAICHLACHELTPPHSNLPTQQQLFVTVGTFDCLFAILQQVQHTISLNSRNYDGAFVEVFQVKTDYPILHCVLEFSSSNLENKNPIVAFVIDIYSNLYTFNLSKQIEMQKRSAAQPATYTRLYRSPLTTPQQLYLSTPLLLCKDTAFITTVSLDGRLRLFDLEQEHSYVSRSIKLESEEVKFPSNVLAACSGSIELEGQDKTSTIVVICLQTPYFPFLFIDCYTRSDFQEFFDISFSEYGKWEEKTQEIVYCCYDSATKTVITSLATQQIQLYSISIVERQGKKMATCQRQLRFSPGPSLRNKQGPLDLDFNIECLSVKKGFLLVVLPKEYLVFDIHERKVRKRGHGAELNKLKWGLILEREDSVSFIALARGYNHCNPEQSRQGKPSLHFKVILGSK